MPQVRVNGARQSSKRGVTGVAMQDLVDILASGQQLSKPPKRQKEPCNGKMASIHRTERAKEAAIADKRTNRPSKAKTRPKTGKASDNGIITSKTPPKVTETRMQEDGRQRGRRNADKPAKNTSRQKDDSKAYGLESVCSEQNERSIKNEQLRENSPEMPYFDVSTREGRRKKLEFIGNYGVDTIAHQAIKTLENMAQEDLASDPNAKIDIGGVCAFLARAHLKGAKPIDLLDQVRGLDVVAEAIGKSMELDSVAIEYGGKSAQWVRPQEVKGDSVDGGEVED